MWQVISKGADNHWWDCEVYQVFLAQIYNVFQLTEQQPASIGTGDCGRWWKRMD